MCRFPAGAAHLSGETRAMKIVALIKQVPDTTEVRIHPETHTLVREGVEAIVNPFDTYALEEAVRLRERAGGGEVTALSMGPPQVEAALREALSVGADRAVLLTDPAFAGADTWATSLTLAAALGRLGFDLVLAGKQAIDGDTAQVGPGVAAHLRLPHVCYVSRVRELGGGRAVVEALMDGGTEVLAVSLPAVLTVVKDINEPRMPSLRGKLRARAAAVERWGLADLKLSAEAVGLEGSPTSVTRVFSPPHRAGGEMIEGESPGEKARALAARLRELGLVR
jgi:electron transfer flavoprotein beta subunit